MARETGAIQPRPLFGAIKPSTEGSILDAKPIPSPDGAVQRYLETFPPEINVSVDYWHVQRFLTSYSGKASTYKVYRGFVERLLLWSWIVRGRSVLSLVRSDAEDFMRFNKTPPADWIGPLTQHRFVPGDDDGLVFNPEWRPFSIQKKRGGNGEYIATQPTLQLIFASCSTFYSFMNADGHPVGNPFSAIKQKSTLIGGKASQRSSKSLTQLEWDFLLETAELMADEDPRYERSLFIVVALFSMYLRIGDLAGNGEWTPTMGSFSRRGGNWWYSSIGKGGVEATISVKPAFIPYLKRYRESRNLTPLPTSTDSAPLLIGRNARRGLSARHIRTLVQEVFDRALARMRADGRTDDECMQLQEATVHWLRHTGATFDAPHRPAKHLQLDLRHRSLHTTHDVYYNSIDEERAASSHGLGIRR
ncbi:MULTISPECIES: tyrosine-type recombinase/integrase [Stutzerimonas]|uniref:tyrosine-type recombinase/integrase n=1 Tax=Stutzerimonas TaxID=2901164 RepID=UPI0008DCF3F6|nr:MULTISPECIES: hypothetical protein [Stutzerimonas]